MRTDYAEPTESPSIPQVNLRRRAHGPAPAPHPSGAPRPGKGPNDRITLGVIGTGTQGRGLLNNFLAMPDTQVVAVCDVDTTRREHHQKVANEFYSTKGTTDYKGCAAYKEFREVLARKDIDAVVIAVPDHWHAYVAIAACKAGKDVYCEKPLSLTIHEARAMVKAARKYDRVFQTGSMQRSSKRVPQGVRAGAQRAHRQGQTGHRGRGTALGAVRLAGRDDGAGPELGYVAGSGAAAALQFGAQPARRAYALPQLAELSRILRAA